MRFIKKHKLLFFITGIVCMNSDYKSTWYFIFHGKFKQIIQISFNSDKNLDEIDVFIPILHIWKLSLHR